MDYYTHAIAIQEIQVAGWILSISAIAAVFAIMPAIATGITQGLATARAAEAVGRQPEAGKEVLSTLIVGLALTETSGIYGLLVSLLLLFVNPLFGMFTTFVG